MGNHGRLLWLYLGALLLPAYSGTAQQGTIVAAGYSTPPRIFSVVAGQIITVYASGVGQSLTNGFAAAKTPLPTSLGGISATLILTPGGSVPIPLLAVLPIQCGEPPPCSNLVGVTLQIPFEIGVPNPLPIGPPGSAQLVISDGVNSTDRFQLAPLADQAHVLRYGDTVVGGFPGGPLITHADGSLVSAGSPALVGEELVMYGVGLGPVNGTVKTGDPAPTPALATTQKFTMAFDYRPNALPSRIVVPEPRPLQPPVFAGLVPGFVGLYQVNFIIPAPAQSIVACGSMNGSPGSNLTITLIGASSFDGAGICVRTSTN